MAHSLPHNLKNLCHIQITTAHRHLSIYVHIVFMKFLCRLQRFVPFFICLKYTHKTLFPVAHQEHSSTEQHSTMALRYSRYRLTAWFLRDPYEVFTRSAQDQDFARQGSRARQQGSFLLFPSLLCASLITSTLQYLQFDSLLDSTLLLFCSTLLLFSLLCESSYWEAIPMSFYLKNMCAPAKC